MIIPCGSDAPVYHWPIVTVLMIALNVGVFFAEPVTALVSGHPHRGEIFFEWIVDAGWQGDERYLLQFGRGMKPWQWITSSFVHAHLPHLLGNMIVLAVFGLIVEGKVGWWKFLGIYLGISALHGFLAQSFMQVWVPHYQGAALGASAVIWGLIAISLLWAPLNHVQVAVVLYMRYLRIFDVPLAVVAGVYLLWDLWLTLARLSLLGLGPSTALFHTIGGLTGGAIGILFLKFNLVDCENWDAFSIWQGRHTLNRDELDKLRDSSAHAQAHDQEQIDNGLVQIREILEQQEHPQWALKAHLRMKQKYATWDLPDADFLRLINQLCQQNDYENAALAMRNYLSTSRSRENSVRLKLASILLNPMQRPGQALSVLRNIDRADLNEHERTVYSKLAVQAKQQKEQGIIDTIGEDY